MGEGLFQVFLSSFPPCPCCLSYIFLIAIQMMALITVNYSTFAVLGFHEDLFDGCVSFKVYLYTILTTCLFYTFGYSLCVWDYYLSSCGLVCLSVSGWIVVLVIVVSTSIVVVACVVVVGWVVAACILPFAV